MIRNYFKIAFRNLQRNRVFATINVLGLALGITCAILIFKMVNYHLSFDTFHSKSDRIYRIVTEFRGEDGGGHSPGVPSSLPKAFRNDYTFAEKVARVITFDNQLISIPSEKEIKKFQEERGVAFAESELFDMLDFPLEKGDKKTALAEPNSAIITAQLAQKYFGDENPLDKTIRLDNRIDLKITGVLKNLPENTDRRQEIYISNSTLETYAKWLAAEDNWSGVYSETHCFVLLKKGTQAAQVEKAFPEFSKKYHGEDADTYWYHLQPIVDMHFNPDYNGYVEKRNLWALSLIGLFLIITACVNFVNLATAQALNRSKEVGVRKVLGGHPRQLFWQFLSETAVITGFSIIAAYFLSQLAMPFLNDWFDTNLKINLLQDTPLLAFLSILLVTVVFLAGSYPGLVIAGFRPALALKSKITQQHVGGFSLRRVLVIGQFAISQALIIGTIVIASQMQFSKKTDLGFNKDAVVMLPLPQNDLAKTSTLRSKLSQVPGVESVSFCFQAPAANSNNSTDVRFDNRAEDEPFSINTKAADADYLSTFDLKLIAGRNIIQSDTIREYLVNEAFVKRLGLTNPEDVINKNLRVWGNDALIVGVVKDFYTYSFRANIAPTCIMSSYDNYMNIGVKINTSNVKNILAALEKNWSETYPEFVYDHQFLDERIAEFYALDDIMLKLIQSFALIAILIGCLGLYGLVSFMAVQKTKEIGVRKVLGASVSDILWLFGKEFSRLIVVAFVIAAPVAWYVMNGWLQEFEFRINLGASIFMAAIAGTFVVAAVTVGYQSLKSATTNPVDSLKSE
ncbi:MAG: ABC transporter permease [Saprospiraceae bacterium]|nr:ABC transporter permease [Saprospiraceae bacterium]